MALSHYNSVPMKEWRDWRWQLRHSPASMADLEKVLDIEDGDLVSTRPAAEKYPPLATPYYLSLIDPNDKNDPILKQIMPSPAETGSQWRAHSDPLAEEACSPVQGLVHRYPDRALLVLTSRCAVHCRHCLRKRNWHRELPWNSATQADIIDYIRHHPEIEEVIISGGEPLLLGNSVLRNLLDDLAAIKRLAVVRVASRLPAVLPQRFSQNLCALLGRYSGLWLVTHFNHPRELTGEAHEACRKLIKNGVPMVNQTVLLKGINDSVENLRELNLGLLRMRVKPYYLFHGDPVAGTRHFRTGIKRGLSLMKQLRNTVSGLAIPSFAIDLPEGGGKVELTSEAELLPADYPCSAYWFRGLGDKDYFYADDG